MSLVDDISKSDCADSRRQFSFRQMKFGVFEIAAARGRAGKFTCAVLKPPGIFAVLFEKLSRVPKDSLTCIFKNTL